VQVAQNLFHRRFMSTMENAQFLEDEVPLAAARMAVDPPPGHYLEGDPANRLAVRTAAARRSYPVA
jgi:hypothetical protein